MKKILTLAVISAMLVGAANRTQAVELLISGNFEAPGGATGEVPGWELQEFLTGSSESVNSASITAGTDPQLFLMAFAGGGPLGPSQANFDNDGLPAGEVDGRDFLTWQRGYGNTGDKLPEQGDATGDMNVNSSDLSIWQANYGTNPAGRYPNARLRQSVPAVAGETYSFQGTSMFEDYYSGFVTTLGDRSPNGEIPSPTVTQFKMEFLNSSGQVIGSPTVLDLRTEQTFPGFPVQHTPLTAVAPAGTANVRVVAEALNMSWNGSSTQETPGALQSAFFNDFILTRAANPGQNLLTNGDLNLGVPDALDFWNQVENPATNVEILRTASFANHTPGGNLGVWLSAFFGEKDNPFEPDPVDGVISQTVNGAVPGATYTFSGWTRFEANYSGGVDTICSGVPQCSGDIAGQPSPTRTEIELAFLDVNGAVIEAATIDAKAARRLLSPTGNANDNLWYQHTLAAVAPAGSVKVRLTAQMVDGVFNRDPGQSAFFDDFSLDGPAGSLLANIAVPEPSSAVVLVLGMLFAGMGRNRKA